MSRLENQIELFKGQIEELQGRLQQTISMLEGPRGAAGMIRGRGLEMRGKARSSVARARMGAEDFAETMRRQPEVFTPYLVLLALGVTVASFAIFSPQSLARVWDWLRGSAREAASSVEQQTRSMSPGSSTTQGPTS